MSRLQADIDDALRRAIGPLRDRTEQALAATAAAWTGPEDLVAAMTYALSGGGKRIRPALVFAAAEACGGDLDEAAPAAVALELVHTYSLVHDDLPCMDDDLLRRGLPTVHAKFGEALALLVGDALLTESFRHLASATALRVARRTRSVAVLAEAAGHLGMVAGQARDIAVPEATLDALRRMHAEKTGTLFVAACRLGALSAGVSDALEDSLATYGRRLGEAFQVSDDLVDYVDGVEGGHEADVNVVTLIGPAKAAALVAADVAAAIDCLAVLPGDTGVLSAVARWIGERVRRTAEQARR